MNKGFGLMEVFVTFTLILILLSIVVANVSHSTRYARKITDNQQVLESIFHTVDTIKSDLSKCGMRLQEAAQHFNITLFENTPSSFKILFGIASQTLESNAYKGERSLTIRRDENFNRGKRILIYDIGLGHFEFKEIKETSSDQIIFSTALQNDYSPEARVVAVKAVDYKLYTPEKVLKRKMNGGYFQPLLENVSDFQVIFYPESYSVLYRFEVNRKEQIRGYIFLTNMVCK